MNLLDAFERWVVVSSPAPRTSIEYRYSIKRLAARGIVEIADADAPHVSAFVAEQLAKYKAEGKEGREMVRRDVAVLCTVIRYLLTCSLTKRSQLRSIRRCRPKGRVTRPLCAEHLSRAQYETLLDGARERDDKSWRNRPRDTAFLVQADTLSGLRAGELARLKWEQINFPARLIEVRFAPELGDLGRIKNMVERDVPICDELVQVFRKRRDQVGDDRGYLFRNGPRGRKNPHASAKILWRELCFARQNAGLPHVDFRILRHTRASWWLQGDGTGTGVRATLEEVSLWLGDTPEVTARHYAGLIRGYNPACEAGPRPIERRSA